MADMVKKLFVFFLVIVSFASCTNSDSSMNSREIHEDIRIKTEEFVEYFVNDDIDELENYFCKAFSNSEMKTYLSELKTAYDSIDGNVIDYEYKSEGGGQASKRSGKVTYYNCYPEYLIKTDKEKEYRIVLHYNYINSDEPDTEGIYKFQLTDCQTNGHLAIGRNI